MAMFEDPKMLQTALRLLYPPRCLLCNDMVQEEFALCGSCWRDMPFVDGAFCDICGTTLPGQPAGIALECDDCLKTARPWSRGRAAFIYAGTARKLVLALKHADREDLARPAARWMAKAVEGIMQPDMVIAPIPLHWFRLMRRRYNQAALLAKGVAKATTMPTCLDLLARPHHTQPLDGCSKDARFSILADAIQINRHRADVIRDRPVLLVDDVMTSGATFASAADACLAAGASDVRVLSLARVAKDA
jgi:ComF family protein